MKAPAWVLNRSRLKIWTYPAQITCQSNVTIPVADRCHRDLEVLGMGDMEPFYDLTPECSIWLAAKFDCNWKPLFFAIFIVMPTQIYININGLELEKMGFTKMSFCNEYWTTFVLFLKVDFHFDTKYFRPRFAIYQADRGLVRQFWKKNDEKLQNVPLTFAICNSVRQHYRLEGLW